MQFYVDCASFKKVTLTNSNALCLDGTPGAYYVYEGKLTNKWILSFEGGAWCGSSVGATQTLEDCLERSKTRLGSSSTYPDTWQQQDGILSDNIMNQYRDWSKVNLKYCTGTGHQGYKADPVQYKGANLYFRGHTVTIAQLGSLNATFGLFDSGATDIIIHGRSAGGLAVFLWTNYIRDNTPLSTRVISLPEAGIFLDFKHYASGRNQFRLKFQNFMNISNAQIDPPSAECNAAHPTELWKCMFAEYIAAFIKVPLFVIQSAYDSWCIQNILGIKCESRSSFLECKGAQITYIEQYQKKTKSIVRSIETYHQKNGYWVPSCCFHVISSSNNLLSPKYRIPHGSQNSVMKGITDWQRQYPVTYNHMDNESWPSNLACSGLQNQEINLKVIGLIIIIALLILKFIHPYIKNAKKQPIEQQQQNIQIKG